MYEKNKKHARADQLFFPSFQPVLALLRAKKKKRDTHAYWENEREKTDRLAKENVSTVLGSKNFVGRI